MHVTTTTPSVHVHVSATGTLALTFEGRTETSSHGTADLAREAALDAVVQIAEEVGSPVRLHTTGVEGDWHLVVRSDGSVDLDDTPEPAAAVVEPEAPRTPPAPPAPIEPGSGDTDRGAAPGRPVAPITTDTVIPVRLPTDTGATAAHTPPATPEEVATPTGLGTTPDGPVVPPIPPMPSPHAAAVAAAVAPVDPAVAPVEPLVAPGPALETTPTRAAEVPPSTATETTLPEAPVPASPSLTDTAGPTDLTTTAVADLSTTGPMDLGELEHTVVTNRRRIEPVSSARLFTSTGTTLDVAGTGVLGRRPVGHDNGVRFVDPTRSVSNAHLRFTVDRAGLVVEDLGSANGTTVTHDGVRQVCSPGIAVPARRGARVDVGDQFFVVA
ncbi:FHA domain-containing protein [Curtobacterium sp. 9128]|uniref:FHA domain-containing protein n=1 Tax=Curtobacterium sp. 9128 TaxID=1793722 RepID=UPI0011A2A507|nr:FHA domain-containing protein [Curtobacterium sp. 9128]